MEKETEEEMKYFVLVLLLIGIAVPAIAEKPREGGDHYLYTAELASLREGKGDLALIAIAYYLKDIRGLMRQDRMPRLFTCETCGKNFLYPFSQEEWVGEDQQCMKESHNFEKCCHYFNTEYIEVEQ